MRTIVKENKNITRIFGKQQLKDVKYRMMKYVLQAECEDGLLLHNSITGHLVLLDIDEAEKLKDLSLSSGRVFTELVHKRFLVPIEYDEKKTVNDLRILLKRCYAHDDIEGYTIFTTTNCNARCFYCYESELPHVNMDKKTAAELAEYMINHKGEKSLKLHWFGGEPLVCVQIIDQICDELKKNGIAYRSTMTSNGYLFTESMIEKAITLWNLDSVQITLDGTEEIYNKTKAYVSAVANPYRIVMNNIRRLLEHNIRVIIRLNLDKHNMQDLERLVDELSEKLGSNKLLEVYTHVLFENAGFSPIERDEESKKLLYERHAKLSNIIHQKGLGKKLKSLPSLKTHNCMADTNNSLAVYPDGRLFKCEHIEMGDEIGTIREGIIQKAGIEKFITRMELKECISCPLYPSCILLKNCQGVSDKEWQICEYSIVEAENNLKEHYKHYKHKR